MAKKSEEIKNGLVEEAVVAQEAPAQEIAAPTQKVEVSKVAEEVESPGHATRAFRG